MDRKDDREILRKGGFAETEMKRLAKLRHEHLEQARLLAIADRRRLEFVRWLVTTGKLTEQIA